MSPYGPLSPPPPHIKIYINIVEICESVYFTVNSCWANICTSIAYMECDCKLSSLNRSLNSLLYVCLGWKTLVVVKQTTCTVPYVFLNLKKKLLNFTKLGYLSNKIMYPIFQMNFNVQVLLQSPEETLHSLTIEIGSQQSTFENIMITSVAFHVCMNTAISLMVGRNYLVSLI